MTSEKDLMTSEKDLMTSDLLFLERIDKKFRWSTETVKRFFLFFEIRFEFHLYFGNHFLIWMMELFFESAKDKRDDVMFV